MMTCTTPVLQLLVSISNPRPGHKHIQRCQSFQSVNHESCITHRVCCGQVDAQAAGASGQQEGKISAPRCVEVLHGLHTSIAHYKRPHPSVLLDTTDVSCKEDRSRHS